MHIEVQVALNFVISYLYNKLPRRRVNIFGEELEKALKDKFQVSTIDSSTQTLPNCIINILGSLVSGKTVQRFCVQVLKNGRSDRQSPGKGGPRERRSHPGHFGESPSGTSRVGGPGRS